MSSDARAVVKGKMSYDGKMMRPKFKYDDIPSHYATDRNKKGLRKGFYEGISLMKATEGLGRTLEDGGHSADSYVGGAARAGGRRAAEVPVQDEGL